MLYAARVADQLQGNLDRFRAFAEEERAISRSFDRVLVDMKRMSRGEIGLRLADARPAGALAGEEWDGATGLVVPAGLQFAHHRGRSVEYDQGTPVLVPEVDAVVSVLSNPDVVAFHLPEGQIRVG